MIEQPISEWATEEEKREQEKREVDAAWEEWFENTFSDGHSIEGDFNER